MEPSADKPQNPQTGNLEQLFRQKFEEAEIAPRADLWAQIDHDLLVEQNESYRQRLQLHRWAAAACLLFAMAMGAWFTLHYSGAHENELAATTPAARRPASAAPAAVRASDPANMLPAAPTYSNAAHTTAVIAATAASRSQRSTATANSAASVAAPTAAHGYALPAGHQTAGASVARQEPTPAGEEYNTQRWAGSAANPTAAPSGTTAAIAAATMPTLDPAAPTATGVLGTETSKGESTTYASTLR